MTLSFIRRLPTPSNIVAQHRLSLTAEERTRSRHHFETENGQGLYLRLARGTVLQHGDVLESETGDLVLIEAKPEPVMTVTAKTPLDLLKAAYHLGNRHVPLEVTETHLRLSPDPILKVMLEQLGLMVQEEVIPFKPEAGAYGHGDRNHHNNHQHLNQV
ncbi:MAG TPA: urease accessory protein UreE [Trichocoleus sp.]|jgi:urease accessory protein